MTGVSSAIRFEKWKAEGPSAQIKWVLKAPPVTLSAHQRLISRIEFAVDGKEAEKRRGRGELVIFVELTDAASHRWRTHEVFDLTRVPEGAKTGRILFSQDAFVLPGDYKLALAVCDSHTQEHSFLERTVHVAPLRGDPLPHAWRDLPAVEFVRVLEPPDNWFQPYIRGRLRLAASTRHPVHLDIIVNMPPSERAAGSLRVFRRNMSVLLPSLKVLAGINLTETESQVDVTVLDLTTRRVWEQGITTRITTQPPRPLNWQKMRTPFSSSNPGIIDAQSLAGKAEMLRFFRDQVTEKLNAHFDGDGDKAPLRAVIVLSAPVFLEQQYKVETARLGKDPNRRLYYLRYRPLPPVRLNFDSGDGSAEPLAMARAMPADNMEHIVKALAGRLFSVQNPAEFRKALATILAELSRL